MKWPHYNSDTDMYVYEKDNPVILHFFGKTTLTGEDIYEDYSRVEKALLDQERRQLEIKKQGRRYRIVAQAINIIYILWFMAVFQIACDILKKG